MPWCHDLGLYTLIEVPYSLGNSPFHRLTRQVITTHYDVNLNLVEFALRVEAGVDHARMRAGGKH